MDQRGTSLAGRARQAWTIARVELRRVFFAKRGLWVYALALLPAVIFFGHGVAMTLTRESLTSRGVTTAALLDSARQGDRADDVKARLGNPVDGRAWVGTRRVRAHSSTPGVTTHVIEPAVDARIVRLNLTRPTYAGDSIARIYEFEIYGPDGRRNLARGRMVTGSEPCAPDRGPEKAVNGSVSKGPADGWCSNRSPRFLQVDLGTAVPVQRFVIRHASAGGESDELDTREFNIQVSADERTYATVVSWTGDFVEERTQYEQLEYFDGRRVARFHFVDGRLEQRDVDTLLSLEEDRTIFAGIFQYFYLRLAVFFGCLGMFMYLFRGEMANRTLHYWLLAPARREVLLAGKFLAGLIASIVIFGGGALLAFAAMVWPQDPVELQAYWSAGGMSQAFWYVAAAALGCVGYGSVFLAVGLYVRNPIVPAAVLLAWEGAHGILPHALQRLSILFYLQSLCPVPAPVDANAPTLIQLLAVPVAPASRPGAVLGLLLLTAFVLWIAARAVRRMQITYGAEP